MYNVPSGSVLVVMATEGSVKAHQVAGLATVLPDEDDRVIMDMILIFRNRRKIIEIPCI